MFENAPHKCLGDEGWHRTRPVLRPRKSRPPGEARPSRRRSKHSRSEPCAFLGCRSAARRNPRFRLRAEFSYHFFEGLSQVPGRGTESEQIQGASKMRPLPGSCPDFPQGNLERAGARSSDFCDGAVEIILIPMALTVDQYGGTRMDRQTHGITQPRCSVQLLYDSRRPSYFLRPGEGVKNFRCLQKEMIAYPDDFKAAVVEFTYKKLDLWRRAVKEDRPASLWAICQSRNRHVSLYGVPKVSAIANLTPT